MEYISYCTGNYKNVMESTRSVCIYCCTEFVKEYVEGMGESTSYAVLRRNFFPEWVYEHTGSDMSVICPNCGVDCVIGNSSIVWNTEQILAWNKIGFGME